MPDGHVQKVDTAQDRVTIVRGGRRFAAALSEVEGSARVVGARVHFDIDHRAGLDDARNVQLLSGLRTNRRQRRFGDLVGAKRPGAKIGSTSTNRLGVDVTTQPMRVVATWFDAVSNAAFDDAASLYAPNARIHLEEQTIVGRRAIRSLLEEMIWEAVHAGAWDWVGVDHLVRADRSEGNAMSSWFEIDRGAIVEQWHSTTPEFEPEAVDAEPTIFIVRRGDVSTSDESRLRSDVLRVAGRSHVPVETIRVKLDVPASAGRPVSVSASMHGGGQHVRAHVTAALFTEALDTLCLRLRRQVEQVGDRRRRPPQKHRSGGNSWRHADRRPPSWFVPTADEQEPQIVRHKTWGPRSSSLEEAIWDMEQADYDFYLFTEEPSGSVGLVWHGANGIEAQFVDAPAERSASAFASVVDAPVPTLRVSEAMMLLRGGDAPFVFARTADDEPFVLYRRYDGHFGLIEPR